MSDIRHTFAKLPFCNYCCGLEFLSVPDGNRIFLQSRILVRSRLRDLHLPFHSLPGRRDNVQAFANSLSPEQSRRNTTRRAPPHGLGLKKVAFQHYWAEKMATGDWKSEHVSLEYSPQDRYEWGSSSL